MFSNVTGHAPLPRDCDGVSLAIPQSLVLSRRSGPAPTYRSINLRYTRQCFHADVETTTPSFTAERNNVDFRHDSLTPSLRFIHESVLENQLSGAMCRPTFGTYIHDVPQIPVTSKLSLGKDQATDPTNNGQYSLKESIGSGAFGIVYKAVDSLTTMQKDKGVVAIKIVTVSQKINSAKREIDFLKTLDHPNIVSYYSSFSFKQRDGSNGIAMVMQYCSKGSLMKTLLFLSHSTQQIQLGKRLAWYKQLALAIKYIHDEGIAHRDIKPENILLDADDCIKVADVGIAKAVWECCTPSQSSLSLGHFLTTRNGTRPYMAPEIFSGSSYGVPCDVFSLGLVFWMINTLPPRFPEVSTRYGNQKYLGEWLSVTHDGSMFGSKRPSTSFLSTPFPKGTKKEEIDLINKMLKKNPDTRISMSNTLVSIKNILRRASFWFYLDHKKRVDCDDSVE